MHNTVRDPAAGAFARGTPCCATSHMAYDSPRWRFDGLCAEIWVVWLQDSQVHVQQTPFQEAVCTSLPQLAQWFFTGELCMWAEGVLEISRFAPDQPARPCSASPYSASPR